MNWEHIEANWAQFRDNIKQQWPQLTDEQLDRIKGKRDLLADRIRRSYSLPENEAEQQLNIWQEQQNEAIYLAERAEERNGVSP